jgi:hypothetical protein
VSVFAADTLHQVMVRWRTIRVGLAPVVRHAGPGPVAPGRRVTFSAAGSRAVNTGAGIRSVVWRWGDGRTTGPSTQRRATHRYSAPGTYRVRLTVRDTSGVARTVRRTVTVG